MADETEGQIKLSGELVAQVMDILVAHDPRCAEGLIACQYLSAVQAMLVCQRVPQNETRMEIVDELASFTRYAIEDMSAGQGASGAQGGQGAPQAAGGAGEARGVWRPGDP